MDLGLKGRRALVTGATGGIGRATTQTLVEEGADVFVTDVDSDALDRLCTELNVQGSPSDLSCTDGVETLVGTSGRDFDIMVHAAGVTGDKGDPMTMDEEAWQHALSIDFLSGVRLVREIGPSMVERGWGRMVFVTSENVAQPYAEEAVYNASKAALLSFSKSLALAHSKNGVLVNCVAPAFIETPMTDQMMRQRAEEKGMSFEEAVETFLDEERPYLVLGRRGKPEEVAPIIALLCSERASFVTGSNYRIDGGAVASLDI